jgi:hypothetical protein
MKTPGHDARLRRVLITFLDGTSREAACTRCVLEEVGCTWRIDLADGSGLFVNGAAVQTLELWPFGEGGTG